jgi:adenosylcobinamide-phosphate synthase
MSFFAVLLALFAEQLKPLPRSDRVHEALMAWMRWTGRNFNAGGERHAWVVWCVAVLAPVLAVWAVHAVLARPSSGVLALLWNVLVLYLTLGFRQFSHYFTDIRDALERGDEAQARLQLAQWCRLDASELPRVEMLRHVIEESLLAAHRHVFGVFFCFVVFAMLGFGPAGAVLYRMASFASRYWTARSRTPGSASNDRLMLLSRRLFDLIDAAPARLTAFGFAVVGNFEESVTCWRRDAGLWRHANEGVILAAAAGAVGVRLGAFAEAAVPSTSTALEAQPAGATTAESAGPTSGMAPQVGHLRSVVGLVWRSVVLWMLLLALLSLANLVG